LSYVQLRLSSKNKRNVRCVREVDHNARCDSLIHISKALKIEFISQFSSLEKAFFKATEIKRNESDL